jgi:hypothetical protein
MARLRPTLADYVVIGISPALIMCLVSSLVFFLIEVFYQGSYNGRLTWIMGMFVMGAVGVARISIEEGREHATIFALPLAIVTAIATLRFVQFSGPLSNISWLVSLGLIGLIWWCADRLTWDCTVLDEGADASGEGLLQTVGLDYQQETPESELEAVSGTSDPVQGLWNKFVEHRRRAHAPGVWVVYFSLAALPIFGFGQGFLRQQDLDGRRYVFRLLFLYVASGLGLLLTTSFLGLRRYLRKRQIEMPVEMAGSWMVSGTIVIVVLLLFCMLLPRRNAEYSISHLPIFATSPDNLRTSRWAFGSDGPEDEERANRTANREVSESEGEAKGQQKRSGDQGQSEGESGGESSSSSSEPSQSQFQQSQSEQSQSEQSDDQQSRALRDAQQPSSQQRSAEDRQDSKRQDPSDRSREDRGNADREQRRQRPSDRQEKDEQQDQRQGQQQDEQTDRAESRGSSQSSGSRRGSRFSPSRMLPALTRSIGSLLKAIYWLIVIVIVVYLLRRYHEQVARAIREFIKGLRDLLDRLLGRQRDETPLEEFHELVEAPPRPFSSFQDPFTTGVAQRYSSEQLVKYSFEAFEAWGRERGCERIAKQTPQEFAQIVARRDRAMTRDASRLADLYNWSAYSDGPLPRDCHDQLAAVWRRMQDG